MEISAAENLQVIYKQPFLLKSKVIQEESTISKLTSMIIHN